MDNFVKSQYIINMTSINSPFRYAGGKFYARKLILSQIPDHDIYVEPFAGGASIFFAKPKVKGNWLNDIDEELINCLIHIRDNPTGIIDFLKEEDASKEKHYYYKNIFKPKNNLEKAARWFYVNRTSYSGIMKRENCYWGYGDKYSMRPENWPRAIHSASLKLKGVRLTSLDFEKFIDSASSGSFLFIDPPYFNADQNKFYTHSFTSSDHQRLVNCLKHNKNRLKFLLTYDDSIEIKNLYSWVNVILKKQWNYTINRTDDQSKKSSRKGSRYKGHELFIMNYVPSQQVSLPLVSEPHQEQYLSL